MRAFIPAAVLLAAGGVGYFADDLLHAASAATTAIVARSNCNIKGNISIETGEHIYHVPGQEYYAQTIIRPEYGERWFCSEAEARKAGWRRSKT
ncbi:sunset domain-containing protein [Mesorhizobium shangrilense]|uniref:Succinoglycan biosynthesis protein exoi n=1 Tax=Mesorhizobium shangrilense TaxID=460060 RepID=A0ABV2D736_9HYPH